MRGLAGSVACVCVMALMSISSVATAQDEWSGEDVTVNKGKVGKFQGSTLRYDVRTKFATLTSSQARVALSWRDKWAKEDVEQVLIEEERYARGEQYTFTLIKKIASVQVVYPCPKDRRDTLTMCTELWEWQKSSRRFTLKSTEESDPVSERMQEVKALIKRGKLGKAKASIKAISDEFGEESLDSEALFEVFWALALDDALQQGKKDPKKGAALVRKFLADPPIKSAERCPNKELITVCLEPDVSECGCSNAFGQVSGLEGKWPRRYTALAKMLGKAKDYELAQVLLVPALGQLPDDSEVQLIVADMYWEKDQKYKARPLYKQVRAKRLQDKTYIPNRVFERFNEAP